MDGLQKILLVEDNIEIIDLYVRVLKETGYQIATATTVDEALIAAKEFEPDIILLDVMLPGKRTGLDALMILRTDPTYGCTKKRIVMLTNLGLTDRLQAAWEEYADGFVIKAEITPHDLPDIIQSFQTK